MPGENCCVVGCGTNRRHKGVGIFKLPSEENWRTKFLNEITKSRDLDKHFKGLIEKDAVFTCERHFKVEEIVECK